MKTTTRRFVWFVIASTGLLLSGASRAEVESLAGCWIAANGESIMQVSHPDGSLRGVLLDLRAEVFEAGEEEFGAPGTVRTDARNKDPELRKRQVKGMNLYSDFRFEDDRWQGTIYDPESGNTYSALVNRDRKGRLKMRGYIGVPMFGRTVYFEPFAENAELPWLDDSARATCVSLLEQGS